MRISYDIPEERPADVLVVGGGSSGIAAAVSAARCGARTVLVERYGFVGGTSTAGLVGPFMTSYSADGKEQVVAGVFQEVVDRMVALGGAIDPSQTQAGSAHAGFIHYGHAHVTPFHAEALKLAAVEMLDEAGVELRFHTSFVNAMTDRGGGGGEDAAHITGAGRITGAVVLDKGGLRALPATVVVDASADGDVAARAGAAFTVGRAADGKMMPATMFFRVGGIDDGRVEQWMSEHAKLHPGERPFECLVQQARREGRWNIPREYINLYREPRAGEYRINTTRIHGIDGTNPLDLSRAEVEGRRQVGEVMRFLREHCPGCADARLLETAAQAGIRETRHVTGVYVLSGDDVLRGARFPDAVARCAYPIDIHDPTGTRGSLKGPQETGSNFYDIPYRCLVPAAVEQLLIAGRCISATHEGAASARVIPACYATGQAAGTAAALAVRQGVPPRRVPVDELRDVLRRAGAIV
jgi:glycine/D-amino acid oxidase-like deaminating enzyme